MITNQIITKSICCWLSHLKSHFHGALTTSCIIAVNYRFNQQYTCIFFTTLFLHTRQVYFLYDTVLTYKTSVFSLRHCSYIQDKCIFLRHCSYIQDKCIFFTTLFLHTRQVYFLYDTVLTYKTSVFSFTTLFLHTRQVYFLYDTVLTYKTSASLCCGFR